MNNENAVGTMWLGGDHNIIIRKNEAGEFVNPEDEVKDWVHCLNNPWSGTSVYYEVTPTYGHETNWTATLIVVVYDSIDAHVCAVGATPQEAITAVDNFLKELTEKYYEEKDDADSEE